MTAAAIVVGLLTLALLWRFVGAVHSDLDRLLELRRDQRRYTRELERAFTKSLDAEIRLEERGPFMCRCELPAPAELEREAQGTPHATTSHLFERPLAEGELTEIGWNIDGQTTDDIVAALEHLWRLIPPDLED